MSASGTNAFKMQFHVRGQEVTRDVLSDGGAPTWGACLDTSSSLRSRLGAAEYGRCKKAITTYRQRIIIKVFKSMLTTVFSTSSTLCAV